MREDKLRFKSEKLELVGVLTSPELKTGECIILCHGMTTNKDEYKGIYTELAHKLAEVGFNVFRFDFRGHGESQGSSIDLTVAGEAKDIESAVKFLKRKGFEKFGIVAASFAGGPAVLYTSKNQEMVKALCLWNPLLEYQAILDPQLPWPKANFGPQRMRTLNEKGYIEIEDKFRLGKALFMEILDLEPYKELSNIKIPVIFIHGDKDTYVPYNDSVLYSKIPPVSKLITLEGSEHGFSKKEFSEKAQDTTVKFFRQAFF